MSPGFRDLLAEFNAHSVEFLVVGAHALAAHGIVRATKDLDIWVRPSHRGPGRSSATPVRYFRVPDLAHPAREVTWGRSEGRPPTTTLQVLEKQGLRA